MNTREPSPSITVGILSRRPSGADERPFGPPTGYFEECCVAAGKLGMRLMVFDARDVDAHDRTVAAATYAENAWRECGSASWPDVIYDRAPLADFEYTPLADRARQAFIRAGIPFVNPLTLLKVASDKWTTFRMLTGAGLPLPETCLLDAGPLRDMANRHPHLYIKPLQGSQGAGIIEIIRISGALRLVRWSDQSARTDSPEEMEKTIFELIQNSSFRNGSFLVQQGISPEPIHARTAPRFDLRALMQKDEQNVWALTGVVARVSRRDFPTTNLSTGAWSEEAEPVLESVYGAERGREILTEITRIGHETVRFLEQETGVFGELGVDIIPDERGYPWIIEINGKPGRSVFKRIARSEEVTEAVRRRFQGIREESVARPLRYAATLARRK